MYNDVVLHSMDYTLIGLDTQKYFNKSLIQDLKALTNSSPVLQQALVSGTWKCLFPGFSLAGVFSKLYQEVPR